MPYMRMKHPVDPKKAILDELGDIKHINVFQNRLLVAIYIRPAKTASGIILTDKTTDEDKYQGKVGLVIKKGPQAFVDPENKWFNGLNVEVGEWVYFRPSESWPINVHGVECRMIDDTDIRGTLEHPDAVW
jgi:co-chaperonin GroES (HSP10)